ncbi:unnamed protein product [Notodromas monacha]|uniref:WASH complex subunit 3 n=1 Tax=Notodromas monacha TaxID=399045 RepID=A0A7R9GKX3_9CRUS|nr:unnamed protein product [Notodromas monacha]CAG0925273.1 unnamed protein product [Notodromas monacha]
MTSELAGADLETMPPVSQKKTQAFVNHYLMETVNCLNRVAETCTLKLDAICVQMDRMETSLSLLENKLASIPGIDARNPANPVENAVDIKNPVVTPRTGYIQDLRTEEKPPKEVGEEDVQDQTRIKAEESEVKPTVDPQLIKFHKMLQFGVPLMAVKQKMAAEGFDPNLLQYDFPIYSL